MHRIVGRVWRRVAMIAAGAIWAFLAAGCGGSAGGTSTGTTPVSYSGLTEMALVTEGNAVSIASGSYLGTQSANTLSPFSEPKASPVTDPSTETRSLVLDLTGALRASMESLEFDAGANGKIAAAAMQTASGNKIGDCGGTAAYRFSYDENSGAFSGNLDFNGYCANQTQVDGATSFSGIYDSATHRIDWYNLIFNSLTLTAGDQIFALDGELDCDLTTGSDVVISIDLLVRNSANQVCWLNNYVIHVSGQTYTLTGRYYSPDYGYVDITTEIPLVIAEGDTYPSSGVLLLSGAGSTAARLSAQSATTWRVQADTDGEGTYDYDSGEKSWASLQHQG